MVVCVAMVCVGVCMLIECAIGVHHEILLGLRGGDIGEGGLGILFRVVTRVPAHCHGDR